MHVNERAVPQMRLVVLLELESGQLVRGMFLHCSIYIYIRKHLNWQWSSFPASHPLSPAPTCTLAFWSITSTITDYSTERAVAPPPSTSPLPPPAPLSPSTYPGWHSNLPVTFCIFNCCACKLCELRDSTHDEKEIIISCYYYFFFLCQREGLRSENTFVPDVFVCTCLCI